jgi:predicted RNA-binding Zn ribbon-like protein
LTTTELVNTTYDPDHPEGSLRSAKDVLAFLIETELVTAAEVLELRRALSDRSTADRFYDKAIELRTAITAALAAFEARRPVPEGVIALLNDALRAGAGYEQIVQRGRAAYDLTYHRISADLADAFVAIARATAQVLANPRSPVRKCANPECTRHFYDDSRTGRRRWCEMAICGNRAKVSAFLERKRAVGSKRK